MREVKYRGLTAGGVWKFGFPDYWDSSICIHVVEDMPPTMQDPCGDLYSEYFEVKPETVGQYTGLKDKNGVEIFEGDKVVNKLRDLKFFYVVIFEDGAFRGKDEWQHGSIITYFDNLEVVGNIHEGEADA